MGRVRKNPLSTDARISKLVTVLRENSGDRYAMGYLVAKLIRCLDEEVKPAARERFISTFEIMVNRYEG